MLFPGRIMGLLPISFRNEIFIILLRKLRKFVRNIWILRQIFTICSRNLEIAVEDGDWQQTHYMEWRDFYALREISIE